LVIIDEIGVNQHLLIGHYKQMIIYYSEWFPLFSGFVLVFFAQGFVVSLLTAAAVYHAIKDTPDPHDIHGHKLIQHETTSSSNHHN